MTRTRPEGPTVPGARATWNAAAVLGLGLGLGLGAVYAFEAARYRRISARGFELVEPPVPGTPDFARLVEVLTVAPLRKGNRVTVLRNGCQIFPAMLDAIRAARETIDFTTYVYWTGSIAPEFADALAERAAAGVAVNVLLDAVGAAKMEMNNRTHRKILVVDGRVGFTGGVGIAEEWTGNCEDPGHWRDTHVRVEGSVVRDLVGGFLDNWAEATGTILSGSAHLPDLRGFEDGIEAQVTRSAAEKGSTDAEQLFYSAIAGAKARVWLATAYFAPRRGFVEVLCDAVESSPGRCCAESCSVRQCLRRRFDPAEATGLALTAAAAREQAGQRAAPG